MFIIYSQNYYLFSTLYKVNFFTFAKLMKALKKIAHKRTKLRSQFLFFRKSFLCVVAIPMNIGSLV